MPADAIPSSSRAAGLTPRLFTATVLVAVLFAAGCQIRREPAPVGVRFLRVAEVTRATDRPALSPIAWSPDGLQFAYGGRDGVWVHTLGDAVGERIATGGPITAVAWARADDVLAYVDRGMLHTVGPDGRAGRRIPLKGITSHPVWAPGGDRLAVVVRQPGAGSSGDRIWITSADGATLRQVLWDPRGLGIAVLGWYPDALHLFVGLTSPDGEGIVEWWRVRIAYPDFRRLPGPPHQVVEAVLSPSGEWVAFVAAEPGGERAHIVRHDGSGARAVSPTGRRIAGLAWASHSDKLAYGVLGSETQAEIYAAATSGEARMPVATYRLEFPDPAAGLSLAWAPNEMRLAYGSNTGSTTGPVWMVRFATR